MENQKLPTPKATAKAKRSLPHQLIKFSTDINSPETKSKMLLYKKLLKMEMLRDELTSKELQKRRQRRQLDEEMGKFSKHM
ncbi:uncharacterized protein Dwil_GK26813 [Drosophila willistoni]|uniref:Uncharacterized protein n=1 Tax=Drosophila willistoni TaxID=7260 RepID=A0A0Q9WQH8_DROWI|nr:uncharacterized protein LOC26528815 [Drosophila willistoni]KRF98483.1 uncharacterized protein Dwil_GK26813 [Drosophila willistoni]